MAAVTPMCMYPNEADGFNGTNHTICVTQANYSLLIIISFASSPGTPSPKHFFLARCPPSLSKSSSSILNDISLWADNWHDSVNCQKLKVRSNYMDSHRRRKVSGFLCGATPLMRQPPIIEHRQTPTDGNELWRPLSPSDGYYPFVGASRRVLSLVS